MRFPFFVALAACILPLHASAQAQAPAQTLTEQEVYDIARVMRAHASIAN